MIANNKMQISFPALSVNEGFARTCVASFCLQLNPSIEELNDIKTAVSEAVTNCVVHAYPNKVGNIILTAEIFDNSVLIVIKDEGVGIADFEQARQPFFTTKPDSERSGMGFAVMESFMDEVTLSKNGDKGLCVTMRKEFGKMTYSEALGG